MRRSSLVILFVMSTMFTGHADTLEEAFGNGVTSGQIRLGYIENKPKLTDEKQTHATAIGGQLRYETAKYHGFDAGVAFYTSHDINGLSGDSDDGSRNEELASSRGHYSLLAESYIDYTLSDFTIRIGRQKIDTPYADSDDIRMTPNTFEAALAAYTYDDFTFMGAYLTRWQGPDAESDYEFVDLAAGSDGLMMAAVTYASDSLEAGIWYYGEDKTAAIFYGDAIGHLAVDTLELSAGVQYADQREKSRSGVGANLYGAIAVIGYRQFTIGVAYDNVDVEESHEYFEGFGGGAAFVNMDDTTAGAISLDQDVVAWKFSVAYDLEGVGIPGLTMEYLYGDYDGKEHSRIHEQDFVLAYAPRSEWDAELIYAHIRDGERDLGVDHSGHPADGTFDRILTRVNYNF